VTSVSALLATTTIGSMTKSEVGSGPVLSRIAAIGELHRGILASFDPSW